MKNKFLIDANSLITPNREYYSEDITPDFLKYIKDNINDNRIILLDKVKDELKNKDDNLSKWASFIDKNKILLTRNNINIINNYKTILKYIETSEKYTETALRNWSNNTVADPWIIATAIEYNYIIISFEQSAGNNINNCNNPKIPDIAKEFNVKYERLFDMMRELKISF